MEPKNNISSSPIFCAHANEVPVVCCCPDDCYCRVHSCTIKCKSAPQDYEVPIVGGLIEEPNEQYEEAITQMRQWLSSFYSPSKIDRALHIEKACSLTGKNEELRLRAKLWTCNNEFSISGVIRDGSSYLGCSSRSRKPRTGETWTRGNDLADGQFTNETWHKIVLSILRYEIEEIKSEKWKERSI